MASAHLRGAGLVGVAPDNVADEVDRASRPVDQRRAAGVLGEGDLHRDGGARLDGGVEAEADAALGDVVDMPGEREPLVGHQPDAGRGVGGRDGETGVLSAVDLLFHAWLRSDPVPDRRSSSGAVIAQSETQSTKRMGHSMKVQKNSGTSKCGAAG